MQKWEHFKSETEKNYWKDSETRPIDKGATNQCLVKQPWWMLSQEALGHVNSFKFDQF